MSNNTHNTGLDLTEKAVLVRHTIRGKSFGRTKKDKALSDRIAADHGAEGGEKSVKASKVLISPSFTEKLGTIGSKSSEKHMDMTLPWDDKGSRILPTAAYFDYMEAQREYRDLYRQAAAEFEDAYPAAIEEARGRLGRLFNSTNYPDASRLFARHPDSGQYKRFCIGDPAHGIEVLPLPNREDLRVKMHGEEVSRLRDQIEARVQRAVTGAMTDLWARLREPIETMAERLEGYQAGDIKRFERAWIDNVREIVQIVPKLNLTGDERLDAIVADANGMLLRWSSDQLRNSAPTRAMVKDNAKAILQTMAAYCGAVDDDDDDDLEEAA